MACIFIPKNKSTINFLPPILYYRFTLHSLPHPLSLISHYRFCLKNPKSTPPPPPTQIASSSAEMEPPTPSPLSPIPPISPNREIYWKTSWDDIPVEIESESMDLPSETPDLEDLDADLLIVPDTPDYKLGSWWESDSVSTIVPESPLTELDPFPTVVPETPATKRRRRRPVEEEEWFKSLLVMLLPGMADLL